MSKLALAILWLAYLSCLAFPAQAEGISLKILERMRDRVSLLAFDPTSFFRGTFGEDASIIRIVYRGDDYGWPVYSVAIAEGCLAGEALSHACRSRLTARMVRSPAPPDLIRARQRGLHLVRQLVQRRANSRSAIKAQLKLLGVEWMEADLNACPGINTVLARSAGLDWVPAEISDPGPRESLLVVAHADTLEVVFDHHFSQSRYVGYAADGSPAAWAHDLAEALEACWKPAQVPPPWGS